MSYEYELRVASCGFRVASCGLEKMHHRLPAAVCLAKACNPVSP